MAMTKEHRALVFQEGVAFLIAGTLAIILPLIYNIERGTALGWILNSVGMYKLTQLVFHDKLRTCWVATAIAGVYLGIGIWLVSQPGMGWTTLSIALSCLFGVQGVLFVIQAWHWRGSCHCWSYLVLAGLVSVAIAALMWTKWAEETIWIFGLLLGIQLATYGAALVLNTCPVFKHGR